MITNEMKAAAAMTPLAKRDSLVIAREIASPLWVRFLSYRGFMVEPDVASQSVILIHTRGRGQSSFLNRRPSNQKYSIRSKTGP